jgi:hypothetical protein
MICLDRTKDSDLRLPQGLPSPNASKESRRAKNLTRRLHAYIAVALVMGAAFSLDARADYWFKINDASQIQYLIGGPQIYLRNLNVFDDTVLGLLLQLLDRCLDGFWQSKLVHAAGKDAVAATDMDLHHQSDCCEIGDAGVVW